MARCGRPDRLQVLIALTGNYAFFNLLTIALCTMLFDDRSLRMVAVPKQARWKDGRRWRSVATAAAIAIAPLPVAKLASQIGFEVPMVRPILDAVGPFRSINSYGLFAVMTTTRPEIVVEGSSDGVNWRAYEFRHKPGSVTRGPSWVAPFQPRLDWQMWFAALGRYEEELWFQRFCRRLLDGSPSSREVTGGGCLSPASRRVSFARRSIAIGSLRRPPALRPGG